MYIQQVEIDQLIVSLHDGEIENYIGQNISLPSPMLEFVISKMCFFAKTHTFHDNYKTCLHALPIDAYYTHIKMGA